MTDRAARWVVSGRVQGVGYRWFVQRKALELAVVGWATNLPDGRVEVVARGSEAALGQLERAVRAGPPFAVVENVEMSAISHEDIDLNFFDTR